MWVCSTIGEHWHSERTQRLTCVCVLDIFVCVLDVFVCVFDICVCVCWIFLCVLHNANHRGIVKEQACFFLILYNNNMYNNNNNKGTRASRIQYCNTHASHLYNVQGMQRVASHLGVPHPVSAWDGRRCGPLHRDVDDALHAAAGL